MTKSIANTNSRTFRIIFSILGAACFSFSSAYARSNWKKTDQEALRKFYPLSKRAMFAPDRITKEGIILTIEKPGIAADPSSDMRFSVTYVKDGIISEQGGFVAAMFTKKNTRVFNVGEKVYVIGIKVDDNKLMMQIMSQNMFNFEKHGSTHQIRYKAAVIFKFKKHELQQMSIPQIETTVAQVLATGSQAAQHNTISLGQTVQQVQSNFGPPQRIIDLGIKKIFFYKDMKVIFKNGKVTDVE